MRGAKSSQGAPDRLGPLLFVLKTPAGSRPAQLLGTAMPTSVPAVVVHKPPARAGQVGGTGFVLTKFGKTLLNVPFASVGYPSYSQRNPRLKASRGVTLKSS